MSTADILTSPPLIRIFNSPIASAPERVIIFDHARNQPVLRYFTWEAVDDATPTETESHTIVPHPAGVRLRVSIDFRIFLRRLQLPSTRTGFTVDDLRALQQARALGKPIEVYPHESMVRGQGQDSRYQCLLTISTRRTEFGGIVEVSIDATGLYCITNIPEGV
jgi:hypothetical protein